MQPLALREVCPEFLTTGACRFGKACWGRHTVRSSTVDYNLILQVPKTHVERLKAYQAKLVVFPRKRLSAPKNGDASAEECKAATQLSGTVLPLSKPAKEIEMADVTDEMKSFKAFTTMRVARKETKVDGDRIAAVNAKKKD